MGVPTYQDIYDYLEGYGITSTVLSTSWITARITNMVVPFVERVIRHKVSSSQQYTEYLSGTGKQILILSRKPISTLDSINYVSGGDVENSIAIAGIEVLTEQGILKTIENLTEGNTSRVFVSGIKNIKVVYTADVSSDDSIKEAITMLTCELVLGQIGARTGGGSLSVQGFGRNYGSRGKYQDIRNDLKRQAMALLSGYKTHIVGR